MSIPAIEFRNVVKRFEGTSVPAVNNVSFSVEPGHTLALVGPSGCGKTTSLKMINRLVEPTSGDILVNGRRILEMPILELRRSLGYVIQHIGLFPHMTVAENIAVVPQLLGWRRTHIESRIDDLLELVGLPPDEFRKRRPRQLSGGQQQRVGVARALAADPPILLMDEPFGALDPITRANLQREVVDIQQKLKKTFVIVTHDIDEAVRLGERIAVLRDGHLVQLGEPRELLARPADAFVSDLLGRTRLLKLLQTIEVSAMMVPGSAGAETPTIPQAASMEQALLTFLDSGVDRLIVSDDAGLPIGLLERQACFHCAEAI